VTRVAVVALALVVAACGPGPAVRRGVLNTAVLTTLEGRVASARGLAFKTTVPARVLSDDEVARLLDREIDRSFRPGDLDRMERVYRRLGLFDPTQRLRDVLKALYGDQLAGLYDPREKALALTARGANQGGIALGAIRLLSGRDLVGEMLIAHELTHGLQDQHYGLPTTSPPLTDAHGDREIARRALLEGDATLTSIAVLRGGATDAATLEAAAAGLTGLSQELATKHPTIPAILREGLAFQYADGSRLVAALYDRGGWGAVDRAHLAPPTSSEQVLHPDKFLDAREEPDRVTLAGMRALERGGWTKTFEDTVGEHGLQVMAAAHLDAGNTRTVAAGWGGDRLAAFERDGVVVMAWLTSWDTEADADEFSAAAPSMLADATVERRPRAVLVLLGIDPTLAPTIWARSTIQRPETAAPPRTGN
jgi:hypothetical protein